MAIKNMSFRIEEELLNKLHYIASYDDRSANGQIVYLIKDAIRKFEQENGEIELGK